MGRTRRMGCTSGKRAQGHPTLWLPGGLAAWMLAALALALRRPSALHRPRLPSVKAPQAAHREADRGHTKQRGHRLLALGGVQEKDARGPDDAVDAWWGGVRRGGVDRSTWERAALSNVPGRVRARQGSRLHSGRSACCAGWIGPALEAHSARHPGSIHARRQCTNVPHPPTHPPMAIQKEEKVPKAAVPSGLRRNASSTATMSIVMPPKKMPSGKAMNWRTRWVACEAGGLIH